MSKKLEHCVLYLEGPSSWVMHGAAPSEPKNAALPALLRAGWTVEKITPIGVVGVQRPVGCAYAVLERSNKD